MKPYYEHAGIVIYHGDCRLVLPTLPKCDLLLFDPPYGCDVRYGDAYSDDRELYWQWFLPALDLLRNTCPRMAFTHGVKSLGLITGWDWVGTWSKPYSAGSRIGNSWVLPHWEPIYFFGLFRKGERLNDRPPEHRSDVFTFDPETAINSKGFGFRERNGADNGFAHPTPKPLDLFIELCGLLCRPKEIVCDPFAGSGVTLAAAKFLGRKAIGIEIEERYCEIAAKRLSQSVFEFSPETTTKRLPQDVNLFYEEQGKGIRGSVLEAVEDEKSASETPPLFIVPE